MSQESYPPMFRQENTETDQNVEQIQGPKYKEIHQEFDVNDDVPVIDLQCLDLEKIGEACKGWGLFRLVNHGIPVTLLAQLQEQARDLFSLSFESKQALSTITPLNHFWGTPVLTPSGTPLSRGPQNINWVEGLNAPLSQLSCFQGEEGHRIPILDSFRVALEEYGRHIFRVAAIIFKAMAKNLRLDLQQSESYLSESTGFLRIYRYPRCSKANEAWGADVHTDSSVLSILNQDQVGGLEFLKDEQWLPVKPIPHSLILNLGDMMQAISNDEYKSVKHRVKVNEYEERFSICYFVFPAQGSVIRSSGYRPFTYSDFQAQVQQDVKTVGFKVGLERFKLAEAI